MNENEQLIKNNDFFNKQLAELLQTHSGEFVLVYDSKFDSFFKNREEALEYASKKYELGTFLIKKIEEDDGQPKYISFRCAF